MLRRFLDLEIDAVVLEGHASMVLMQRVIDLLPLLFVLAFTEGLGAALGAALGSVTDSAVETRSCHYRTWSDALLMDTVKVLIRRCKVEVQSSMRYGRASLAQRLSRTIYTHDTMSLDIIIHLAHSLAILTLGPSQISP